MSRSRSTWNQLAILDILAKLSPGGPSKPKANLIMEDVRRDAPIVDERMPMPAILLRSTPRQNAEVEEQQLHRFAQLDAGR